jgi:hypothetical protein
MSGAVFCWHKRQNRHKANDTGLVCARFAAWLNSLHFSGDGITDAAKQYDLFLFCRNTPNDGAGVIRTRRMDY